MLILTIRHEGYFVIQTPQGEATVWNLGVADYGRIKVGIEAPRAWPVLRDDVEYRKVRQGQ